MLKLNEIRANLVKGDMFARTVESRFGDYIEIVKRGDPDPVAFITLNKGDEINNNKVRRDLIDIESERRYRRDWDEHLPLIENFVGQLKNAGFTVNYKPERSTAGVVVYANELKISINFACFDKSLFSRNAIIYVNGDVLWTSVSADADRILALLSGDYLSNLINDQERSSAELARWFKTLDLSDD